MKSIPDRINSPWVTAALGFLVGILIGLPVLGWWVWPVQWTDATPAQLREDYRLDYLRMTVLTYSLTGDGNVARQRFEALGPSGGQLLNLLQQDPTMDPKRVSAFLPVVADLIPTAGGPGATPPPVATPSAVPAGRSTVVLLLVACLVTLTLGAVLLFFLQRRRPREAPSRLARAQPEKTSPAVESTAPEAPVAPIVQPASTAPTAGANPLDRFVTTYVQGDDLYEDSFTINSPAGEFLGECGVGISEPIGVGEPKKVTAFEVWLFDKRDTRTSTYVLMSEYAFKKEDLRQRLSPRGTPLQGNLGSEFLMETQTLQARVQIRELQYGRGPLPANSFFDRLTLQLEVSAR